MKRFLISLLPPFLFAALAISGAGVCFASSFKITPVQVLLSRQVPTGLLTLKNESDRTLRFQADVFSWDQDPQGRMRLTPTRDVVFFPTVLSVQPGEERKVRVGTAAVAVHVAVAVGKEALGGGGRRGAGRQPKDHEGR